MCSFRGCTFLTSTLITLMCVGTILAQAPDTLWTKTYSTSGLDLGDCVLATPDNGYIVAGAYSGAGSTDIWILRTDSLGDTLWTKTYGGSSSDRARCIDETQDSGYVIVGLTSSFGAGSSDIWLLKTDASGDTLWTKTYGGTDFDDGYFVQEIGNGGYIVAGWTESFDVGGGDAWILKTNSVGDTVWAVTYGSTYVDVINSIVETQDGGYVLVGGSEYYAVGDLDIWLMKIDSLGATIWNKIYAGTSYLDDCGQSIQITQDSGYIIAGYTEPYSGGIRDVWVLNTDASGDTIWTRKLGGVNNDYGMWVCETQDGGYAVAGYTESFGQWGDIWVIRLSASGDTLWTTTYGTANMDNGYCIRATQDGGYIISGLTYGANYDLYLVKTGPETAISEHGNMTFGKPTLACPSPFKLGTQMRYNLPNNADVKLDIYCSAGRLVRTIFDGNQAAGEHYVKWDGRDNSGHELASGIYFLTLRVGDNTVASKLVLIK